MLCSKIGSDCPHPVAPDEKLVFVMMPFKGFGNIYDSIQLAVESIDGKAFKCIRADDTYTTFAIWCKNICRNIRRAKYLVVDTTGRNPNVFYELGFSHALENTKAILITQNVQDAPFDIADLNHITYSPDDLKNLREQLQKAILDMEHEDEAEDYRNKTSEELIQELKLQLRQEEVRTSKFKNELLETEAREQELKEQIKEIEAIQKNPVAEAKSKISKLEGTIAELKSKLRFTEQSNRDEIDRLTNELEIKAKKLYFLEKRYDDYKINNDERPLSQQLFSEPQKNREIHFNFSTANAELEKGNFKKAIEYFTKCVVMKPDFTRAFNGRGLVNYKQGDYGKALIDFNKAIELNPQFSEAINNRGLVYYKMKQYHKAIEDYNTAINLSPKKASPYRNRGVAFGALKDFNQALRDYNKSIELSINP